jgi:hypothetical protein
MMMGEAIADLAHFTPTQRLRYLPSDVTELQITPAMAQAIHVRLIEL